jgi:hypothetical protein
LYKQPEIPKPFMESNMKLNTLIAAALVATSSAAFAGIDNGAAESTFTGGELVLVAWDDAQEKSILFDTGVRFASLIDAAAAGQNVTIDLAAIDPTYKSFFNNNFSNVSWNLYVANNTSNGDMYDDVSHYGLIHTTNDAVLETQLTQPMNGFELVQAMNDNGATMELFVENFAEGGQDFSDDSVNKSYRQSSASEVDYLGDLPLSGKWGRDGGGFRALNTADLAGESMWMVWNNVVDTNYGDGKITKLSIAQFDPTSDSLKITNTPLPAAAWLLMSGIAGFGAIARRRKQQA